MNLAAVFSLLILGMLTLTLPACKRNTAKQAPLLSSGSASGGVTEEEINEEIQAGNLEVHQNQDEALQALGAPTWDEDEEEEEEAAPAKPDMDVQAEEQKAQQDRKDTEDAVNATLARVMGPLRGCYDASTLGSSTVTIRVHRMGYVLNSGVTGAPTSTGNCIERVLSNLRINGVKTDTITVTRTFQFKAR